MLEELRIEAVRQTDRARLSTVETVIPNAQSQFQSTCVTNNNISGQLEPNFGGDAALHATLDSDGAIPDIMSDFTDWDQFASMLSSGLGNLDAFYNQYPFGQTDEFAPAQ